MGLLTVSSLLCVHIATMVSARHQSILSRNMCPSSSIRPLKCPLPDLEGWNYLDPIPRISSASKYSPHLLISDAECREVKDGEESYCVFSSHNFASGRGISILTTPERAESLHQLPAFTEKGALSDVNIQTLPPFEERELPGRGRGLVSNKTLHRGDRIFAHTPILVVDGDAFEELEEKEWIDLEHDAVNNLPSKTREGFFELYGQPTRDPVSDRIDTNAFELELGDMVLYAIFPEIARLNHDCRPNAAYFFDEKTLTHYVHAITDIQPGTEITITYVDPHLLRQRRLKQLSSWGFNCSCSLCSLSTELARASDERLIRIAALREQLEDWETAPLHIATTLLSLYEQERLFAPSGDAFYYAALISCANGYYWKTIKYSLLAIEMKMLDDGFSDEDVQLMKHLATHPVQQSCWLKQNKIAE